MDTYQYTGGLAKITASRLTAVDSNHFATAELWVNTNGTWDQSWVEEGLHIGHRFSDSGTALAWFYAEQDLTGTLAGYKETETSLSVSLGTSYNAKISYNGGNKWAFYRDGAFIANSTTNHANGTGQLQAGAESTADGNTITGTAETFQKRGSDNVSWSYHWPGSGVQNNNPPVTASWINVDDAVRFSQN